MTYNMEKKFNVDNISLIEREKSQFIEFKNGRKRLKWKKPQILSKFSLVTVHPHGYFIKHISALIQSLLDDDDDDDNRISELYLLLSSFFILFPFAVYCSVAMRIFFYLLILIFFALLFFLNIMYVDTLKSCYLLAKYKDKKF